MIRPLSLLFLGLALALPASGSVARSVSFEEKVAAADSIVLGKIVSTGSQWDPSRRWIVTHSTIQVEQALKGAPAPQVTIVTPGGTVDGVRQETIGVPSFSAGDERVVFLRQSTAGPTVAFFDQGVYEVTRDGRGRAMIAPMASGLVLVDSATAKATLSESSAPMSIDEFQGRVQRSLREGARRMEMRSIAERQAEAPATDWRAGLSRFAREQWKILALAGLGLLLALVPVVLRNRS